MDDDFNTPEAVAVLFDLANELNREHAPALAKQLRALGGLLGLLQRDAQAFHQAMPASEQGTLAPDQVEQLIGERAAAKKAKNYAEADRIRKALADGGIVLEDTAKGTSWRRA
jgi:cysteinyl-tRNA synthetase